MRSFLILFFVPFFLISLWKLSSRKSVPEFTDKNCIQAIVGEYGKEDIYGMKLIAHAIRNRGTLEGVYGFNAKHIHKEPKNVWVLASLAWYESAYEQDPLRGAHEWRSVNDVRKGHTPNQMWLVKIYNGMYFYKQPND